MIGKGFQENVSIDEGLNPHGVRTVFHWEGDELITQNQQDMTAALRHVREMRERNEGKGWGEGKEVGHIPALYHGQIALELDPAKRRKLVKQFFRDHPEFCAYPAYLKQ